MAVHRFPLNASVYEAMRTHPRATARLSALGVTREYYDYRLSDAAAAVGVPVERLSALLSEEPEAEPRPAELAGV